MLRLVCQVTTPDRCTEIGRYKNGYRHTPNYGAVVLVYLAKNQANPVPRRHVFTFYGVRPAMGRCS